MVGNGAGQSSPAKTTPKIVSVSKKLRQNRPFHIGIPGFSQLRYKIAEEAAIGYSHIVET